MLSSEFRHQDRIMKIRRVRTPEGSRYFDAPIGTPITAALEVAAKIKNRGKPMPKAEHEAHNGPAAASPRRPKAVDDAMKVPAHRKGKAPQAKGTREEKKAQYHAAIAAAKDDKRALVGIIQAAGNDKDMSRDDLEELFAKVKDPNGKPAAKVDLPEHEAANLKEVHDRNKEMANPRPKPGAVAGTPKDLPPDAKTPRKKPVDEPKTPKIDGGITAEDFAGDSERAKLLRAVVGYERDIAEAKDSKAIAAIEQKITADDSLPDVAKKHLLGRVEQHLESKVKEPKAKVSTPDGRPKTPGEQPPAPDKSPVDLGTKVDSWEKAILSAKNAEGLKRVEEGVRPHIESMDKDQSERLLAAFDKMAAKVGDKHEDEHTNNTVPEPSWLAEDMDGAVQVAEHFKNGGSIGDAPAAGLWNAVINNKRFEVKANSSRGIAANFWVTDKDTGEKWMFKRSHFDGIHDGHDLNEHANELMAAELWKEAGGRQHTVKLASSNVPGAPTMLAQRHWQEEMDPTGKLLDNQKHMELDKDGFKDPDTGEVMTYRLKPEVIEGIKKGSPDVPLKMMVYDYLINNAADRHGLNFLLNKKKDGSIEMGVIDQGLAFEGGHAGTGGAAGMDLTMEDFLGGIYRADLQGDEEAGGWHLSEVIMAMNDGDKKKLKAQLKAQVEAFGKSGMLDDVEQRMQQHVNENQREMVTNWLDEYAFRLDWLDNNIDHMVDVIAQRGGAA